LILVYITAPNKIPKTITGEEANPEENGKYYCNNNNYY
jgi:hypothetical protein